MIQNIPLVISTFYILSDYSSPDATPIYPEHRSKKRKHEEPDGLSPGAKMSRKEASYNCTQCSYRTDKRTALMVSKIVSDEVQRSNYWEHLHILSDLHLH